jgi:hypothetical protein
MGHMEVASDKANMNTLSSPRARYMPSTEVHAPLLAMPFDDSYDVSRAI